MRTRSPLASVPRAWLTTTLCRAGTWPPMFLAEVGDPSSSHVARRDVPRASAVYILLTGCISIARGLLFVQLLPAPDIVRCALGGASSG